MKRIPIITVLAMTTACIMAAPRHIIVETPATKREATETYLRRFGDPNAKAMTGTKSTVTVFWYEQFQKHGERLTEAKIATSATDLGDASIKIMPIKDSVALIVLPPVL